jgi:hypothetical protein
MPQGPIVGTRFAIRLGNLWLRRIFLTVVWALGLKALVFGVFAKASGRDETPSAAVHQKSVSQGVHLLDTSGLGRSQK